jgi:hypothetical protein
MSPPTCSATSEISETVGDVDLDVDIDLNLNLNATFDSPSSLGVSSSGVVAFRQSCDAAAAASMSSHGKTVRNGRSTTTLRVAFTFRFRSRSTISAISARA